MSVIYGPDAELPDEIAELVTTVARGPQAWVGGTAGEETRIQQEEMTLYGPFGGPVARMGEELLRGQAAVRSQFQGGTSHSEVVQVIRADDLVILVGLVTNSVKFAGRDHVHPWNLRVTEVFKRDGETWRRLHRHADPLVKRRSLEETLALLAD